MLSTHNTFTILFVYASIYLLILGDVDANMGGPADILINSLDQCPDPEQYKYTLSVTRHKVNRTHEAFDGSCNLGIPLDEKTGIYVNVAKKTGDTYKPNAYEFRDDQACVFLKTWVGKGFTEILENIGQPQSCPLKAGNYNVKNFILDYREMPQTLPYGNFRADMYIIREGEKVMCFQVFLVTKPKKLL